MKRLELALSNPDSPSNVNFNVPVRKSCLLPSNDNNVLFSSIMAIQFVMLVKYHCVYFSCTRRMSGFKDVSKECKELMSREEWNNGNNENGKEMCRAVFTGTWDLID